MVAFAPVHPLPAGTLHLLVLLCWPAIIWLLVGCVWAVDSVMLLMGKPLSESFTVYLQPLMTFSALVRISLSWVVLLFILFGGDGFTWLLRRVINRKH
jgi:hypothetical protein